MSEKQIYSYSKKSRWRNIKQVTLYVLLPLFLFLLLLAMWGNFFLELDWNELLSRIGLMSRLFGITAIIAIVVGTLFRASLTFELDNNGISSKGWGRTILTIPYNEITEIKESNFDSVQIKSEHLNRTILLSPSHFNPDDYAEIKALLENWKPFTRTTENELIKPLIIFSGIAIYGILFPLFYASANPVIKTLPFAVIVIFALVMIFVTRKKQEAPISRVTQFSPFIIAVLAGLMTILIYLENS